jgi:hypothetical protein
VMTDTFIHFGGVATNDSSGANGLLGGGTPRLEEHRE